MSEMKDDDVRAAVREHYGNIARGTSTACAPACCSSTGTAASALGYTADQATAVPEGADLGLGCGNPTAIASLRDGETVLDLGAGGGFDCFIAAHQVGSRGRAQLRQLFEACCEIALDARGKVIDYTPRPRTCTACK